MEEMDSLQLESFSYRWLISMKGDTTATAASFIDIDPSLMSFRWTGGDAHESFDFGTLVSHSPRLSHADDIFSGGVILPLELVAITTGDEKVTVNHRIRSPDSVLSRSISLDSTKVLLSLSKRYELSTSMTATSLSSNLRRSPSAAEAKVSSILKKYLCFLMPLYKKMKGLREGIRRRNRGMDGIRRPGRSSVAVVDEGLEKSIDEAVLHCKKSIGV